ncbi:MAG: hypothetical protein ACYC1A_11360, partial [Spirochaetales bacterium]
EFVDGVENIAAAMEKSAKAYLEDGSISAAIPPLKAVLAVMATGSFEGKSIHDPELRRLFDRDYVVNSAWYKERLSAYQGQEIAYIEKSIAYIRTYLAEKAEPKSLSARRAQAELARAKERLEQLMAKGYLVFIDGSIGKDPLYL